jgi:hypothetical protein
VDEKQIHLIGLKRSQRVVERTSRIVGLVETLLSLHVMKTSARSNPASHCAGATANTDPKGNNT